MPPGTLHDLLATMPQHGVVTWIGVRPQPRVPLIALDEVEARLDHNAKGAHGGITARVLGAGVIRLAGRVAMVAPSRGDPE